MTFLSFHEDLGRTTDSPDPPLCPKTPAKNKRVPEEATSENILLTHELRNLQLCCTAVNNSSSNKPLLVGEAHVPLNTFTVYLAAGSYDKRSLGYSAHDSRATKFNAYLTRCARALKKTIE